MSILFSKKNPNLAIGKITVKCAWCTKIMGLKIPKDKKDAGMVTHGICKICAEELSKRGLTDYLLELRKSNEDIE